MNESAKVRGTRLTPRGTVALAVALVLVAVNLRTTVASLPPLLSDIRQDIPLTGAAAGLLTATPVLCMAWLAPLAARLARRWGRRRRRCSQYSSSRSAMHCVACRAQP